MPGRWHDAAMPLKPEDHELSAKISPRGRRVDNAALRTLLVNRLSDTYKAVLRRGLRSNDVSMYCEDCGKWTRMQEYPQLWTCPVCETSFRIEFAVYEEVEKPAPVAEQ